jgi:hypothetical protein
MAGTRGPGWSASRQHPVVLFQTAGDLACVGCRAATARIVRVRLGMAVPYRKRRPQSKVPDRDGTTAIAGIVVAPPSHVGAAEYARS